MGKIRVKIDSTNKYQICTDSQKDMIETSKGSYVFYGDKLYVTSDNLESVINIGDCSEIFLGNNNQIGGITGQQACEVAGFSAQEQVNQTAQDGTHPLMGIIIAIFVIIALIVLSFAGWFIKVKIAKKVFSKQD